MAKSRLQTITRDYASQSYRPIQSYHENESLMLCAVIWLADDGSENKEMFIVLQDAGVAQGSSVWIKVVHSSSTMVQSSCS